MGFPACKRAKTVDQKCVKMALFNMYDAATVGQLVQPGHCSHAINNHIYCSRIVAGTVTDLYQIIIILEISEYGQKTTNGGAKLVARGVQ